MASLKVYAIDGIVPVVDLEAFVHPTAVLIGDVVVGPGCYVGPCASLRGDFGRIVLARGANVQDTCVIHTVPGREAIVEEDGHVGHGAVLHSCTVGRNALIGMNAVVMDGASVGESAFVAACSFVKAEMVVPPRILAAGVPAKLVRELTETELSWKKKATAAYQALARRSPARMIETEPLTRSEDGRRRMSVEPVPPLNVAKRVERP